MLTIYPSTPIGTFSGVLNCTEATNSTLRSFIFKVVSPKDLKYTNYYSNGVAVNDCGWNRITRNSINFTDSSGIEPSMIEISSTPSDYGDEIFRVGYRSYMDSDSFTQKDVDDGIVYMKPKLSTAVSTSRESVFRITAKDPSGTLIEASVNFNVTYAYCLNATSYSTSLMTPATIPHVIGKSSVSLFESHGLSTWDVKWIVPTIPLGRWEYYCPDKRCDGPGWKILPVNTEIKQV